MEDNKQPVTDNIEMDINSDADIPGNTHLSNPEDGQDESFEKLQEELQDQKDKYLRLFAEFDNYKRRTSKEKMEMMQTAGKDIIISMLDVLDDCERAEKQMETSEDLAQVKEGNKLVFAKLKNVLTQKGLKPIDSINTEFDVEQHEAITEIEAGEEKAGKVVDEIQKGYTLNGKQIRFAKVVVGK
ncbi:MAG: nucleotide exchange factor GrpE [Sphingobacteriales bacterium]|nr:MAG: nucleotide exchange factor GrpE [Sphingobacteriales bacterium]